MVKATKVPLSLYDPEVQAVKNLCWPSVTCLKVGCQRTRPGTDKATDRAANEGGGNVGDARR